MNVDGWDNAVDELTFVDFKVPESKPPEPEPYKPIIPPKPETKAESKPDMDIMKLLPLLTGKANQADILASVLGKDNQQLASLLPLLMNLGNGHQSKKVQPHETIDLSNYRRIN